MVINLDDFYTKAKAKIGRDALYLTAFCFDIDTAKVLSGGQIENIARKQQVEYILTGKQSSMADLRGYCKQEFLHNAHTSRKTIGFAAGN